MAVQKAVIPANDSMAGTQSDFVVLRAPLYVIPRGHWRGTHTWRHPMTNKLESSLKKRHPIFCFLPAMTVSFMALQALACFVSTRNGWISHSSLFYQSSASTVFHYSIGALIWWVVGFIFYVRRRG